MDDLFSNGINWKHRTLRTVFDPYSSEWNDTSMEQKVSILKKLIESGEMLEVIAMEYKDFYKKEINKPAVANDFDKGLIHILEYLMKNKT